MKLHLLWQYWKIHLCYSSRRFKSVSDKKRSLDSIRQSGKIENLNLSSMQHVRFLEKKTIEVKFG